MSELTSRTLVVGTDGSPNSVAAFDWAVQEVLSHGGQVRVVSAWHRDQRRPAATGVDAAAKQVALDTLQAVPHAAVDVTVDVVEGPASAVLVEAAEDADLLVVGSLGLEAERRAVLGSVSALVALHAGCPVVVVPAAWRARSSAGGRPRTGTRR